MSESERSNEEIISSESREWQERWKKLSLIWRPYLEQSGKKDLADRLDSLFPGIAQILRSRFGSDIQGFWPHHIIWLEEETDKLLNDEFAERSKNEFIESMVSAFERLARDLDIFKSQLEKK